MALRKPLFIVALILILLAVLAELGSALMLGRAGVPADADTATPGYGILYMAALDGMVLYVVALMGASLLLPEGVHSRVQGIATLILSIVALLGLIAMIIGALLLLGLMVGLLLAPPFGPIAYAALGYATFPTGGAAATLSVLMLLKLGFAGCLLFAHQRFLQNKTLVLLVLTSLLANVIVSFLHGFVPVFIVSVADVIAALIVCILAVIWAVLFLVGGIVSLVKVIRIDRAM